MPTFKAGMTLQTFTLTVLQNHGGEAALSSNKGDRVKGYLLISGKDYRIFSTQ